MPYLAGIGPLGPLELVLILVILFAIFGVGKLPQVGTAVGRAIREFRTNVRAEDIEPRARSGELPKGSPSSEAEPTRTSAPGEGQESPRS